MMKTVIFALVFSLAFISTASSSSLEKTNYMAKWTGVGEIGVVFVRPNGTTALKINANGLAANGWLWVYESCAFDACTSVVDSKSSDGSTITRHMTEKTLAESKEECSNRMLTSFRSFNSYPFEITTDVVEVSGRTYKIYDDTFDHIVPSDQSVYVPYYDPASGQWLLDDDMQPSDVAKLKAEIRKKLRGEAPFAGNGITHYESKRGECNACANHECTENVTW